MWVIGYFLDNKKLAVMMQEIVLTYRGDYDYFRSKISHCIFKEAMN